MLAHEPNYRMVGEANNGQTAYEMLIADPEKYQLLLTDISMPLLTGTQLCRMVATL